MSWFLFMDNKRGDAWLNKELSDTFLNNHPLSPNDWEHPRFCEAAIYAKAASFLLW